MNRLALTGTLPAVLLLGACSAGGGPEILSGSPVVTCQQPENLVENCGFDLDLSAWIVQPPLNPPNAASHVAGDGASQPGSMEIEGMLGGSEYWATVAQCIDLLVVNETYDFGAYVRVASGAVDSCNVYVLPTNSDCSSGGANSTGSLAAPGSAWTRISYESFTWAPSSFDAVLFTVNCRSTVPYAVRLDDLYVIPSSSMP